VVVKLVRRAIYPAAELASDVGGVERTVLLIPVHAVVNGSLIEFGASTFDAAQLYQGSGRQAPQIHGIGKQMPKLCGSRVRGLSFLVSAVLRHAEVIKVLYAEAEPSRAIDARGADEALLLGQGGVLGVGVFYFHWRR
jgi:hypothetical protein